MEIEFEITGKMPSLNEVIDITRKNKYAGARFKKELQYDIEMQLYKQISEKNLFEFLPLQKQVDFEIIYVERNKKRDKDNISSCKKFLFDALVQRGVINNDGWKWVGRFVEDFILGEDYKVIIRMKEKEN